MARGKRKVIESPEEQIGQDASVRVSVTGKAAIERPDIQIVDGPNAMKKAEELAFMEEPVRIMVHESTDPNAENPIEVSVNGRKQFIFRGQEITVRRKFVERLARAKATSYRQDLEAQDPTILNTLRSSAALRYPFSVLDDKNPRGPAWLKKVFAEAV